MENDPKDRHVLAAAVHSGCELIVTFNVRHFPEDVLKHHDLAAVHPGEFLLDQLDLYPQVVEWTLMRQAAATARPELTPLQLIESFEKIRLMGFAAELRRRLPALSGQG